MRIALAGGYIEEDRRSDRPTMQPSPEINLIRGLRDRGHQVIPLPLRDWRRALRLAAEGADVIHVNHCGRTTLALALRGGKVPLVFTPHTSAVLTSPRLWLAHQSMLRRADRIIALSPLEAASYDGRRGDIRDRVVVIPNGVDPTVFSCVERRAPGPGERWRLLYVGQLASLKRIDLIIRAVAAPHLRDRCTLRIVHHTTGRESELRALVRRLGLEDQVVFAGRKAGLGLAHEYHSAHIYLQLSRVEALPSVITEAMLTGLPVIASDVGGVRWQLDGWGRCLKAPTIDLVAQTISEVIGTYDDYVRRSVEISARTRVRFGLARMIEQHEELYRNLIDQKNPARARQTV